MKKLIALFFLSLALLMPAHAVWPPSTALQEGGSPILYGVIVVAFVAGLIVGVWALRNRNEHK